MNWKQLVKAVVDEVKKWASDRFAELGQVKALIEATARELRDAQGALAREHATLARDFQRHAAAPPPPAIVDATAVTAAVAAWFAANPPPIPKDGTSVTVEDLEPYLQAGLAKWQLEFERNASGVLQRFLEKLRQPKDGDPGKDATPDQVAAAVAAFLRENPPQVAAPSPAAVSAELAAIVRAHLDEHPPAPGQAGDPGRAPTEAEIAAAVARHLEAHPIEPAAVESAAIARAVAEHLQAWPIQKPSLEPGDLEELVAAYLAAHPPAAGKDGVSVTVADVQPLFDVAFGQWALDFERRAADIFERAVERIAKPKDGRDGLEVTNLGVELGDDGRTLRFVLADGERRHVATCRLPIPLDQGVFKDGAAYERGDLVTFGGSMWIAQKDAPEGRPGTSAHWRLAVKHGRDAKK